MWRESVWIWVALAGVVAGGCGDDSAVTATSGADDGVVAEDAGRASDLVGVTAAGLDAAGLDAAGGGLDAASGPVDTMAADIGVGDASVVPAIDVPVSLDGDAATLGDTGADVSEAGGGDDTAAFVLSCASYCAAMAASCPLAYPAGDCLSVCAALPLGTAFDGAGNTVGCRYAQQLAGNCEAAGPTGGGLCGTACEVLCDLSAGCPGMDVGCADDCDGVYDVACSIWALAGGSCALCEPPPVVGESCEAPVVVSALPFAFSGDSTDAKDDLSYQGGLCGGEFGGSGGSGAPDQVFRWAPTAAGSFTVSLKGEGGYDPILYILTDCAAPSASCLDKKDSIGFGATEVITVSGEAGQAYYIVVDAADGQSNQVGAYTLTLVAGE